MPFASSTRSARSLRVHDSVSSGAVLVPKICTLLTIWFYLKKSRFCVKFGRKSKILRRFECVWQLFFCNVPSPDAAARAITLVIFSPIVAFSTILLVGHPVVRHDSNLFLSFFFCKKRTTPVCCNEYDSNLFLTADATTTKPFLYKTGF